MLFETLRTRCHAVSASQLRSSYAATQRTWSHCNVGHIHCALFVHSRILRATCMPGAVGVRLLRCTATSCLPACLFSPCRLVDMWSGGLCHHQWAKASPALQGRLPVVPRCVAGTLAATILACSDSQPNHVFTMVCNASRLAENRAWLAVLHVFCLQLP